MSDTNKTWIDQLEELELDSENQSIKNVNHDKNLYINKFHISTIHGVKYITTNRTNKIGKIFWATVLTISGIIFANCLYNHYERWSDSAIFINVAENAQPIWNIPFPAVTICPEIKTKTSMFNFTQIYNEISSNGGVFNNMSNEQIENLRVLSQVCEPHVTESFPFNQTTINENIFDELKKLAPTFEEVLFFCKMRNKPDICQKFFTEIWTEEGLCFTYNILNSTEIFKQDINVPPLTHNLTSTNTWSMESGYKKTSNVSDSYPYRVHSSGLRGGLSVLLRLYDYNFDYLCRGPVVGFKVLLHPPDELPQISKHYFRVPLNTETRVTVRPVVTTASKDLLSYDWKTRKCYFKSEKILEYFKDYSQGNCEIECLSNFIIQKCGCAKFSMPKNNSTPICGASKISCYHDAEDELIAKDHLDGISNDKTDCNCLPACASMKYDVEITHDEFHWENLFHAYQQPITDPGMQNARLVIVFKDSHFTPISRKILQSNTEMLALFGGLLALFFGASFLSFIEIIYCFVENFIYSRYNFNDRKSFNRKLIIECDSS